MFPRTIDSNLSRWAKSSPRKPLVLRGARQVGKTTVVRRLGAGLFQNYFELNLEDRDILKHFRNELGVSDFLELLKVQYGIDVSAAVKLYTPSRFEIYNCQL